MSDFPKDFLWGAATSSHQVEGDNVLNDWWEWESLGKTEEPSLEACEHYTRFKEDFRLAKELNHNCHRFSLEWSRIEPEQGRFNQETLSHYREVMLSLKALDIEPIVTINHFTLPFWFYKRDGWEKDDSPRIFSDFVENIVKEYGDLVNYWITLNEPVVYAYQGYLIGKWPPGKTDFSLCLRVIKNLIFAHTLAYQTIHEVSKKMNFKRPKVGLSKHTIIFSPCSKRSLMDRFSAMLRSYISNHFFIKSIMNGKIFLPGFFNERLPLKKAIDFIGINYYTRDFVQNAGLKIPGILLHCNKKSSYSAQGGVGVFIPPTVPYAWGCSANEVSAEGGLAPIAEVRHNISTIIKNLCYGALGNVCTLLHHKDTGKRSSVGWEIYPQGIYRILKEFSRYKLPLIITENGICTENDGERAGFILTHLKEIKRAIEEGSPVFGYIYWSLLDNFEWEKGFSPRFGLVEIDYKTQARRIRESALRYAEVCKSGKFDTE